MSDDVRHDFPGAIGLRESFGPYFSTPDADDFAGINPMRVLYDIGVAPEDFRPPVRILQVELRQVPERVALLDRVLDFLGGVSDYEQLSDGVSANGVGGG